MYCFFPYNCLASSTHYIKVGGKGQSLLHKVKDGNVLQYEATIPPEYSRQCWRDDMFKRGQENHP